MPQLARTAPFSFQILVWGFDVAGQAAERKPGDVMIDQAWEARDDRETDYGGHALWDRDNDWLRSLIFIGASHANEFYALPYLGEAVRQRRVATDERFDDIILYF